jgi:hypothetical protein
MRCRACDVELTESEIVWYEDLGCHEELCNNCLTVVRELQSEEELTTIIDEDEDEAERAKDS